MRAVQLMVSETTGISGALTVSARNVDRATWSSVTLTGLEPVLRALAAALARTDGEAGADATPATAAAFSPDMLFAMMMPLLLGGWAGSMIGLLSHRALGQYDLPLPLDGPPALLFISGNVDAFAEEWSLPVDELRYALALREVVHGAQRSIPWVRERLVRSRVGLRRRVRGAGRRDGESARRLRSVRSVLDGGDRGPHRSRRAARRDAHRAPGSAARRAATLRVGARGLHRRRRGVDRRAHGERARPPRRGAPPAPARARRRDRLRRSAARASSSTAATTTRASPSAAVCSSAAKVRSNS